MIDKLFVISKTLFRIKTINDSPRNINAQSQICLPKLISITGGKKLYELIVGDFIGRNEKFMMSPMFTFNAVFRFQIHKVGNHD